MRYELKPCTEVDRDWAYTLKSEAYREVVERQFGPWNEPFQRELFATRWNPAMSRIIVVGGAPVGLLALEERNDGLWLNEIQIIKAWRGVGLGSLIIYDLVRRSSLRLQVLKENSRALQLYRRLDFKIDGETETHHLMYHPGSAKAEEESRTGR
jgi:ribosomal protein S18 acetylase RimI-like enzyme